jgi:DNA-binding transcriptional LysR family regulator
MDKLLAMQAFVRVVEAGTFSRAADTLSLPKPTVTRLVQQLEAQLQTKLLNRTTRRATLTTDGAAYYDRAMRLLSEIEELESSMTRAKANPRGRLRVDAGTAVAQLLLIPALPDFHARYPEVQLDLGVSDRPVDLLSENVDCVLRGGELTDQSLVARRIGNFHTLVCATPGYLERHGMPAHPRDIEQGKHVVVNHFSARTGRVYPFVFNRGEERYEVQGRHQVSVNDSSAALAAALAGLGIVNTATFMAQPYIAAGLLRPVLVDWCSESVPIHVVYPPNRHLSAKLRVFVDWVADLFARSDQIQRQCSLPGCMAAAIAAASRSLPALPEPAVPSATMALSEAGAPETARPLMTG